jgi:hypothetical protein
VLKIVSNKSSTNFWRVPYNKMTQTASSNEKETQRNAIIIKCNRVKKIYFLHSKLKITAGENVHHS